MYIYRFLTKIGSQINKGLKLGPNGRREIEERIKVWLHALSYKSSSIEQSNMVILLEHEYSVTLGCPAFNFNFSILESFRLGVSLVEKTILTKHFHEKKIV